MFGMRNKRSIRRGSRKSDEFANQDASKPGSSDLTEWASGAGCGCRQRDAPQHTSELRPVVVVHTDGPETTSGSRNPDDEADDGDNFTIDLEGISIILASWPIKPICLHQRRNLAAALLQLSSRADWDISLTEASQR
jgi:hypothetical protein